MPFSFEESANQDVIITEVAPKPEGADEWPEPGERVLMYTSPFDGVSMLSANAIGVVSFQKMMDNQRQNVVDLVLQPRGGITIRERLKMHNKKLQAIRESHLERVRKPETHWCPTLARIVSSPIFEGAVAVLIISNCFCIGLQVDRDSDSEFFELLDKIFTLCFLTELVLRAIVENWTFFLVRGNYLDIFLVTVALLQMANSAWDFFRKLTVLRTLRLARVVKVVRYRPELKDMVELIEGTVNNTSTVLWTMVMVLGMLYFFAIFSTFIIGKANAFKDSPEAQTYFGDVLSSMVTLFQVMTLDGWTDIMRSLMAVPGQGRRVCVFFMAFISVGVFVLMNLVVAVIVQNSFARAHELKAHQKKIAEKKLIDDLQQLKKAILEADLVGDCEEGCMSLDHFLNVAADPGVKQKLNLMNITAMDIVQVWKIMELPDTRVRIDDFLNGIRRKKGIVASQDMLHLLRDFDFLDYHVQELEVNIEASFVRLEAVRRRLRSTSSEIGSARRSLGRAKDAVKIAAITQSV